MANRKRKDSSPAKMSDRKQLHFSPMEGGTYADSALGPKNNYATIGESVFKGRLVPGFLQDTYGGGDLEAVPGFCSKRALTEGLDADFTNASAPLNANDVYSRADPEEQTQNYESVFHDPNDDRVIVRNTAEVPWRAICHLKIMRRGGGIEIGTGWFAAPDIVVTAGHNYFDHSDGGFAVSIVVTPGYDGTLSPPYPSIAPKSAYINPRWQTNADPNFDYAFLHLPDSRLGRRTGYFAFADAPDEFLKGVLVNIAGYPHDKEYGTLWYSGGRLFRLSSNLVAYRIDTEGGYSGAPLIYKNDNRRIVIAMHTQGDSGTPRQRFNSGVRITGQFFEDLKRAAGLA